MVEVTKEYKFVGPSTENPKPTLIDLFGPHKQLIIYHFMFNPNNDEGCSSCSLHADNIGHIEHLHSRDTALVCVSRAPIEKIEAFRKRMGWKFPWVSSYESDFNYDYHVTHDQNVAPPEYNFKPAENNGKDGPAESPGTSVFFRDGDKVYHTYSSYARGGEAQIATYSYLDITPLGRQEKGTGIVNFKFHDRY